jgi:hypothetical protein
MLAINMVLSLTYIPKDKKYLVSTSPHCTTFLIDILLFSCIGERRSAGSQRYMEKGLLGEVA